MDNFVPGMESMNNNILYYMRIYLLRNPAAWSIIIASPAPSYPFHRLCYACNSVRMPGSHGGWVDKNMSSYSRLGDSRVKMYMSWYEHEGCQIFKNGTLKESNSTNIRPFAYLSLTTPSTSLLMIEVLGPVSHKNVGLTTIVRLRLRSLHQACRKHRRRRKATTILCFIIDDREPGYTTDIYPVTILGVSSPFIFPSHWTKALCTEFQLG